MENPKSNKIAILSTVINFDLYRKTAAFFLSNVRKIVIDGRNGMHGLSSLLYIIRKLKLTDLDWLIMADEDVVFSKPAMLHEMIDFMECNNYAICGVRDGGAISHRNQNPYVINTFFSIINFRSLVSIFDKSEILKNQYILPGEFDDDLSGMPYNFDSNSLYEPYYCFYFYLRRKGLRFYFLESKMRDDGISNDVYFNSQMFLTHTWYARSYGLNTKHTNRIDLVLNSIALQERICDFNEITIYKDHFYKPKSNFLKNIMRVRRRLKI